MSTSPDSPRPAGPRARPDPSRRATQVLRVARDTMHVRRAFGEPIRQDGVTIVPVAHVSGASGHGYGTGEMAGGLGEDSRGDGSGSGGGGGLLVRVRPLGVYVIHGTDVQWRPALDLGRVILGGQVVGGLAVLAVTWATRRRRHRRRF